MKLPNPEEFNFKECEVAGDKCWLITPKEIGCKWTDDIHRFRSVIVRQEDNYVVSQGFGKFTNFGEKPDFQTWNEDWKFEARHKLDGSLLIVSRYKGQWILRTRGTVDARQLANGHEIDDLMKKYSIYFDDEYEDTLPTSLLFEWTTPNNIIVLREHNEPTLTLLGVVSHETCEYWPQAFVDNFNFCYNNVFERPTKYVYNSVAECLEDVKAWEGKEGVVIYSPDYQTMKKIKSDVYCELHKISTGLVTLNHIIDLFMVSPRFAKYSEFYHYVETTKDYEVAEKIKDHMLTICVGWSKVLEKLDKIKKFVDTVRENYTRREQALEFQRVYNITNDWRLPIAFKLLDNKEVPDKLLENALVAEIVNNAVANRV